MNAGKALALAVVFLLSALVPAINVDAGNGTRTDVDRAYLTEKWHAGLGTGIGSLNSIKSADIDNDGEDELVFGNSQGYVHVLDWVASANAFSEDFQSVDMGGAVKGLEIAQMDDDPQLEIAVGYNWNADMGKVIILDGSSLLAEANWSSGVTLSHTQWTEGWPYGVAMGDLDGDNRTELGISGDRGFLWVVDAETPEIYVKRDITWDEAEWYLDVGAKIGQNTFENTWGLAFGQFDDDEAMEVAVGSKQGWVAIFDGETEEVQWKWDMDGSSNNHALCYSMIAADLDGNGIDELVVPQQNRLTVFVDGGGDGGDTDGDGEDNEQPDPDSIVEDTNIKSGYGLVSEDLFGDSNEELIVADGSGNIRIMTLSGSSLTTEQEWNGGYPMNGGGGVTVSMNGHDNPWIIHGGDAGVIVAWEVTESEHSMVWKSVSGSNGGETLYSLEGGNNYGVAMGNIDDDDSLEILVGSGSGQVYAFDGETYEMDWVSPVMEKLPIGIAISDLNNDGDSEIAVVTGTPGEPKNDDGDGAEGYLYIFEKSGGTFVEAFQSGNIDAALGVTVSELDGSAYPEIGIATGYLEIIDATAGTTDLHGTVRIWGYGGSTYQEEWYDELDQIVGGIDSGDPDGDGDNELVVGTGGDDRESNEDTAEVRVYHRLGGTYALDGSVIDPGRYYAFGIDVGDIDNDGEEEITVGTGEYGESKSRVIIYDGDSHGEEFSKDVDSGSVWGVRSGDFDNDGFAELIYGTSGGELFIYDGETRDYEAKTSALSGTTGHYGGIVIGDVDNEAPLEMLVGSASYMWLFTTEGQTDTPDLAVEGTEIIYSPQNPNEDDDITISVTVHNYGGAVATDWRVKLYDGDPSAGGSKISEYNSKVEEEILSGENFTIQRTWLEIQTDPGYHEIYALVEDTSNPRQETRTSNNKDFTTIDIEEIPNDQPVVVASADKTEVLVGEWVTIDAGDSYDNETTEGQADRDYTGDSLDYRYRVTGGGAWTPWGGHTYEIRFTAEDVGEQEVTIVARDERDKEAEEKAISITVKANTPPVAILTSNISEIMDGNPVTFDVSQSNDPEDSAELEYRFDFGNAVYSDWVKEGNFVRLYQNAFFPGPNGGDLEIGSGEQVLTDRFGIIRVFKLVDGKLLEYKENAVTENGYNYTLPDNSDTQTYDARLLAREMPQTGDPDESVLVSSWSDDVTIDVYKAENLPPVAKAQAGIEIESVIIFNDLVDYAKTGDKVTYTADDSYDPDGDDTLLTYEWRIMDSRGQKVDLPYKTSKTFEIVYVLPGTYTAIVTVTDERGGTHTWQVDVVVSDSGGDNVVQGGDDDTYSTATLIGAAAVAIAGLVGGAMALNRMRGGAEEFEDMFEDVTPSAMELQCPTCGGLISITSLQRPIQVGCPMCNAQFVLRE